MIQNLRESVSVQWLIHRQTVLYWLIAAMLTISISTGIVHTGINTISETSLGGLIDSEAYVASYYGEPMPGHWQYRIVTISLARLVPDQVEALLQRDPTPYRRAHMHFAVVNLMFLILTGLLFYAYLNRFFDKHWLSLLGVVMFLTSRTNVQSAGAPMVDPGAYFFLLLGAYAIVTRRYWLVLIAHSIGVFTKETTLLIWALIWLADLTLPEKLTYSLMLIPGTLAYLGFRYLLSPDHVGGTFFSIEAAREIQQRLPLYFTPTALVDWFSSYYLLWIPAIYALLRCPVPMLLRYWLWLLPILLLMIILLSGNLGRILFLSFFVVIPFVLLAFDQWLTISQQAAPQ